MKIQQSIFFLCLLSLILVSCKTKVPQTSVEIIKFEDNEPPIVDTVQISVPPKNDTAIITPTDTVVQVIKDSKKKVYNVAVILPFMTDSVRTDWNIGRKTNFTDFVTAPEAEVAVSFFEGMQMGLNDTKFDSKFNIKVYDSENTLYKTTEIIKQLKDDEIDIIIGPYSKTNVQEVSQFAKDNNIIQISPFTPSKSASLGNQKYYMIEPSLEQHILSMVQFAIDSIDKPFIKYVYHDSEIGREYVNLVQSYIDSANAKLELEKKIEYGFYTTANFKVKDNIDNDNNNVLIVNSFKEDFLHVFLRQTTEFNKTNNIVFGMPGWETSEIVRLSHLNDAQVHFTSASWIDNESKNVLLFNDAYKAKYKSLPKEDAYLGYDMVALLLKMIDENGLEFNDHILSYKFKGLSRNYLFKKVLSSDGEIHRIENTDLHIYKIFDFEKILVK